MRIIYYSLVCVNYFSIVLFKASESVNTYVVKALKKELGLPT